MEAKVTALPLFPLNVVLFPGQSLPLHIFEKRYRIMIQQCIDNNEPFGVVLAYEHDVPVSVGTSARISDYNKLPDGRFEIMTVGEARFKIHSVRVSEHGYLIGEVTFEPFSGEAPRKQVADMARQLRRMIALLTDANGTRISIDTFPSDPADLAVLAVIALRLPLDRKQGMLNHDSLPLLVQSVLEEINEENKRLWSITHADPPLEIEHGVSLN
jgi:Lon protease-like protein